MAIAQSDEPFRRKPLRLWPGVVAAVLLGLLWYVVPRVEPEAVFIGLIGGAVCMLAIVVWWLLFSRAPWAERVGAILLMVAALWATYRIVHVSIRAGGQGKLLLFYAIPAMSLALGGGQPPPDGGASLGIDGRHHPGRMRGVRAPADGRRQKRRRGVGMAVDEDPRGAAPGTARQRAGGAGAGGPARSGGPDSQSRR
jgi:hypothetical protein